MNPKNYWVNNIFSKTPDSKPLFLLKINIKTQAAQIKNIHVVFNHFHQNIRAYPRSKTNLHWPIIGKIVHIGKNLSIRRCWRTTGLSQTQLVGLGLVAIPGTFCNFFPLLSLETVVPSLKLTQNCYLNMNIFFLKKWQLNHKLASSLFYEHSVPETLSSQSNKMKSMGLQKSQFLNSLVNWEKLGSAT